MKLSAFLALTALVACSPSDGRVAPLPLPELIVPGEFRSCATPPNTPPTPRTVGQIGQYARDLSDAHADCARTLRRLNRWLSSKVITDAPVE